MVKLCGAKARSNGNQPCRKPAMANGRCRFHGGMSTGAKTAEGKLRQKMSNLKHGKYSAETIKLRRLCKNLIKNSEQFLRVEEE